MTSLRNRILNLLDQLSDEQLAQLVEALEAKAEENPSIQLRESGPVYVVNDAISRMKKQQKVGDMTVEALEEMIINAVVTALLDFGPWDPDEGLELRKEFVEELEQARAEIERGDVLSLEEVIDELGLDI